MLSTTNQHVGHIGATVLILTSMDAPGLWDSRRADAYLPPIHVERLTSILVKAAPLALVQVPGPPFEQHVGHVGATVLILVSMDAPGLQDSRRADAHLPLIPVER